MNNTLIEKWKPVLEFQSASIPKLDESKYGYVAGKLEIYERIYMDSPEELKTILHLIRLKEGNLDISCGEDLLKRSIEKLKNDNGTDPAV